MRHDRVVRAALHQWQDFRERYIRFKGALPDIVTDEAERVRVERWAEECFAPSLDHQERQLRGAQDRN